MRRLSFSGYRNVRDQKNFLLRGYDLTKRSQPKLLPNSPKGGVSLENCDFFEWDVQNKTFEQLCVATSFFTDVLVEKCNFKTPKDDESRFFLSFGDGVTFVDSVFEGVDFSNCVFDGCKFLRCSFVNCNIQVCEIRNSHIKGNDFVSCNMNNNIFSWCLLEENYFNGCDGGFNECQNCTNNYNHFINGSSLNLADMFDPKSDLSDVASY